MRRMTANDEAMARRFLGDDQFARLCHIELVSVEPGHAVAQLRLAPDHLNGYHIAQGGVIFTLADHAFAAAANSHGTIAVAISISITFIKAATSGTLRAEAREVAKNPKLGTYSVEVRDEQNELIAQFQGLVYRKHERIADWYNEHPACGVSSPRQESQ
jgi:acyl-CoA thioesterase